jgi:alkaline phosphatase D
MAGSAHLAPGAGKSARSVGVLDEAIYGDFDGRQAFTPTEASLLQDWRKLVANPGFNALRERVPVMATWDNHDYGSHDGGAKFELKEMSRKIFLDFFDEPKDSPRRQREGVYDARILGPEGRRVQVILLDNRWNCSELIPDSRTEAQRKAAGVSGSMGHRPNDDPSAALLGDSQWRWLEAQLLKSVELRLICSGTQIINDTKGMQEWGNFPAERKRLFDLIKQTGAQGVVLLSGNVHYAELSLSNEGPYPLYDFTSSGMAHNNSSYADYPNPYRVAGPYSENHFGLIEIEWLEEGANVLLKTIALDGSTAFEFPVNLDVLRPNT